METHPHRRSTESEQLGTSVWHPSDEVDPAAILDGSFLDERGREALSFKVEMSVIAQRLRELGVDDYPEVLHTLTLEGGGSLTVYLREDPVRGKLGNSRFYQVLVNTIPGGTGKHKNADGEVNISDFYVNTDSDYGRLVAYHARTKSSKPVPGSPALISRQGTKIKLNAGEGYVPSRPIMPIDLSRESSLEELKQQFQEAATLNTVLGELTPGSQEIPYKKL